MSAQITKTEPSSITTRVVPAPDSNRKVTWQSSPRRAVKSTTGHALLASSANA